VRTVLHLVRPGREPLPGAVADGDTVLGIDDLPADELLDRIGGHDLVVVW
jgi:hypothetical protein